MPKPNRSISLNKVSILFYTTKNNMKLMNINLLYLEDSFSTILTQISLVQITLYRKVLFLLKGIQV